MIEIKSLYKKELLEYIHSEQFKSSEHIAITTHRALSQVQNPRLSEDDAILFLAIENDKLLGYLGVLPDTIEFSNQEIEKVGWFSCLWVLPETRGKGIANMLIKKALEEWDENIFSADYAPNSKRVYDKTQKFEFLPITKKGIRLYVKSDLQTILPPKKIFFKKIQFALKFWDALVNSAITLFRFFIKQSSFSHSIEYVTHINNEIAEFIELCQKNELFKRNKSELNWILSNPWILSELDKNNEGARYYFSSTDKEFAFTGICVRDSKKKIIVFLLCSKRNNTLKLPYVYELHAMHIVVDLLSYILYAWNIKTCTTFHPQLTEALQQAKLPILNKRKIVRNHMISKKLYAKLQNQPIMFQDGDGDCAFT